MSQDKKQFYSESDFAEMERLKDQYYRANANVSNDNRILINELLRQMAAINANTGVGMTEDEEKSIKDKLAARERLIKEIDPDFYKLIVTDE